MMAAKTMNPVKSKREDRLTHEVRTAFEAAFGRNRTRVYRYNPASIRVRVIDKRFDDLSLVERERIAWPVVQSLTAHARRDLSVVLLISPTEAKQSVLSLEFDQPAKSGL